MILVRVGPGKSLNPAVDAPRKRCWLVLLADSVVVLRLQ